MKGNLFGLFICLLGVMVVGNLLTAQEGKDISQEELQIACKVLRASINKAIHDKRFDDALSNAIVLQGLKNLQKDPSQFKDINQFIDQFFSLNINNKSMYILSINGLSPYPLNLIPNTPGNNGWHLYMYDIEKIRDMAGKKLTEGDLSQYSDFIKSPSFENLKVNIETIERMTEQKEDKKNKEE